MELLSTADQIANTCWARGFLVRLQQLVLLLVSYRPQDFSDATDGLRIR